MDDVIVVAGLCKDYGDVRAVDDLTFTVRRGEVFALLGPNGAGKTTTVEILEGHRDRTSGTVFVEGFDPATGGRAYREQIGVVLQEAGFDEEFTVRELVRMYASLYPRRRDPDELIDLVGLGDKADSRTKTLSGGQRRRLDLALGLVGDPRLLFLDEPTTGFDPSARRRAWELIASLRSLGTTILLTTHYMEEAEALADRVGVMVAGRLVAIDAPADLVAREQGAVIRFRLPPGTGTRTGCRRSRAPWWRTTASSRSSRARPTADLQEVTSWAVQQGVELADLSLTRATLEDVYLRLTGDTGDRA